MNDQEVRELVARVGKLERDNRRGKIAGGGVVAALLAVALVGAVMPQEIPWAIQAQVFQAVDETGEVRGVMTAGSLFFSDEEGEILISLNTNALSDDSRNELRFFGPNGIAAMGDYGIGYFDENGQTRSQLTDEAIAYYDESGQLRSQMSAEGIGYFDENGNLRARIGRVELITPSTGAETTYPAAVVLYDDEGNVIWQAPR